MKKKYRAPWVELSKKENVPICEFCVHFAHEGLFQNYTYRNCHHPFVGWNRQGRIYGKTDCGMFYNLWSITNEKMIHRHVSRYRDSGRKSLIKIEGPNVVD